MPRFKPVLGLASLALALVIAGCNVLDAAYNEGGSVSEDLEDARHARTSGDYERALTLLDHAYEQEPDNPVVRVEIASTLMQRDKVNLLSLEQVASHVLDQIEAGEIGGRSAMTDSCTWNSTEPVRPFDPNNIDDYEDLLGASPTLARVHALLNDPETPTAPSVIPQSLRDLEPCTAIQDGTLAYDRDAILDELRAHFDGDDDRVDAALTMNAVALTLGAYMDIFNSDIPVTWSIVGEDDATRIGFCMDRADIDPFYAGVDANLDAVAEAFFSLDLLIYNSGDDEMQEVVDEVLELYETFEASFGRFCGT